MGRGQLWVGGDAKDLVRNLAWQNLRHWEGLTRLVGDSVLSINNNAAERHFQRQAKLRVSSFFVGSVEGARHWANFFGLVRTTQRLGLDVQTDLGGTRERRGKHSAGLGMKAKQLIPAA